MIRSDRADSPLSAPIRMPDGRVVYEGIIARPGIYLYEENGRTVRELVPAEVLSDPAWLAELAGASLVVEHPEGAVDADNFRALAVGANLDARIGPGGTVIGRLSVVAAEGHDAIAAGKTGLSPRYHADMDDTPGVDPIHGAYDRRQVRRYKVDQVAICDSPRGGNTMIRRDSANGELMDPKANLIAALSGVGMPEDKLPAAMAAIEQVMAAEPAEAEAEPAADADPMAAMEARLAKLEAMLAAKADSRPDPKLAARVAALEAKEAARVKADSDRAAKADSAEITAAAAALGHKVEGATWITLALAEGARADGLTPAAARAVVQASLSRADARYDGFRGIKPEPVTAASYTSTI